ncbi:MAG: TonB-dependent receptor [Ferruginibacter sp.]
MKWILSCITFLLCFGAYSQVKISGTVTDNKRNRLHGASITIRNSYDGTITDSSGHFSFITTEKGAQVLEVSLSGYSSYDKKISIEENDLILDISIKELITELKAVTITAGSFEASDQKKTTVLTSLDIVTTAGANADVVGALKTLPGTQQVGETEGLFVRGGTATESKIFMDGNLVNNFFYSSVPGMATRGRFNPFLFKGTVFSSGGYSALYGQALSSALILESKDLPDRTEADLSISVIGIGGGIQKLAKNKRSSWGITYNYTNLAPAFAVIRQKQDYFKNPEYHQVDANFRIKTKAGGFIKYYGYVSWNKLGFRTEDIDSLALKDAFTLENLNTYQNLNWKERLGSGWKINTGISYSTNKDNINSELQDDDNTKQVILNPIDYALKNFLVKNRAQYVQARSVIEKKLNGLNVLRFGAEYLYSEERTEYTAFNGTVFKESVIDNMAAAFAETDVYITNNIAAKVGGRVEHSAILNKWNIAPRLSVAYKFRDNGQASFAYGIFYQNPERKYLPFAHPGLDYATASHYILQYQKISNKRIFRTELFYKKYDDLYKTAAGPTGREVAANNNGYGYARGLEIFWRDKKSIENLDYWISYSYLDTKRDFLNYPGSIQPSFAAKHTASLVLKKFVLPWKTGFNASYTFASGRPYYNLKYDGGTGKYNIADQGRTINYNSLGFSLNYLPNLGKTSKKAFIVWVLSVTNVLGQKQVFGYNYSSLNDRKVAVTPSYNRFVYIGCFLSFGIDRTQDAINNNL